MKNGFTVNFKCFSNATSCQGLNFWAPMSCDCAEFSKILKWRGGWRIPKWRVVLKNPQWRQSTFFLKKSEHRKKQHSFRFCFCSVIFHQQFLDVNTEDHGNLDDSNPSTKIFCRKGSWHGELQRCSLHSHRNSLNQLWMEFSNSFVRPHNFESPAGSQTSLTAGFLESCMVNQIQPAEKKLMKLCLFGIFSEHFCNHCQHAVTEPHKGSFLWPPSGDHQWIAQWSVMSGSLKPFSVQSLQDNTLIFLFAFFATLLLLLLCVVMTKTILKWCSQKHNQCLLEKQSILESLLLNHSSRDHCQTAMPNLHAFVSVGAWPQWTSRTVAFSLLNSQNWQPNEKAPFTHFQLMPPGSLFCWAAMVQECDFGVTTSSQTHLAWRMVSLSTSSALAIQLSVRVWIVGPQCCVIDTEISKPLKWQGGLKESQNDALFSKILNDISWLFSWTKVSIARNNTLCCRFCFCFVIVHQQLLDVNIEDHGNFDDSNSSTKIFCRKGSWHGELQRCSLISHWNSLDQL